MVTDILAFECIQREKFLVSDGFHPEHALFIVEQGEFELSVNGNRQTVKSGDIVFFKKKEVFLRSIIKPIKALYYQFELSDENCLSTGKLEFLDTQRVKSTVSFIKNSKDSCEIIHFLNDLFLQQKYETLSTVHDETMLWVMDYLKENMQNDIKVSQIAKDLFLSKVTLLKRFKKEFSLTPGQALINIRVDKAKQLLANSSLSVGQIAEQCGFDNLYYFSNSFKNKVGMSPGEYRKLYRV